MRRRQKFAEAARKSPPPPSKPEPVETLAEAYERVIGKKPHGRMKEETMRERLKEHGHPV